jgi:hypothetical protein
MGIIQYSSVQEINLLRQAEEQRSRGAEAKELMVMDVNSSSPLLPISPSPLLSQRINVLTEPYWGIIWL